MSGEPAFLLTGATGFLGGRMLRRLLQDGCQVLVLSRDARDRAAGSRIDALLEELDCAERRDQVSVIRADLAALDAKTLAAQICAQLRTWGATRLLGINIAASLKMDFVGQEPSRREATCQLNYHTNVLGLERLLEALDRVDALCDQPVLEGLVHYSTCYAHGPRGGTIPEQEIDSQIPTENSYERSKREGEYSIARWQADRPRRIPVTIVRPSIVTGPDTRDGYLAWLDLLSERVRLEGLSSWERWLTGVHSPNARVVDLVAGALSRLHLPLIPVPGKAEALIDLVDVDSVDRYAWAVVQRHRQESLAPALRYLHLSNPRAPSLREVVDVTVAAFDQPGLSQRLTLVDGFRLFSSLLRLLSAIPVAGAAIRRIYQRTAMLQPYLMRAEGARFSTAATAAYFAEIGLAYETQDFGIDYVRSLIGEPPQAPTRSEPGRSDPSVGDIGAEAMGAATS